MGQKKIFIPIWLLFILSISSFGQKEASWTGDWGHYQLMSLEPGFPLVKHFEGELNPDDKYNWKNHLFAIADKQTGIPKLLTDGLKIWDTSGALIENGVISTRSEIIPVDYLAILPLEEYHQKKYLLITRFIEIIDGPDPVIAYYNYSLSYSEITENEQGKFSVTKKNIPIFSGEDIKNDMMTGAAVCGTIKHSDNISTWLIMKHSQSDSYYVFLINACGIELKHIYPAKDLIPNYTDLQPRHYTGMELYSNGYVMDARRVLGATLNYFYKINQSTGELSLFKYFNFREHYFHAYEGYNRYWMHLTDSMYFYTGGMNLSEDLIFFQFDLANTPSGTDIAPVYSHYLSKDNIPAIDTLPEARVIDTRIYPYLNGRLFLNCRIAYAGGASGTDAQIFAEFKFPDKKCPDCGPGEFSLLLDKYPEYPDLVFNSYWYTYWFHNRSHFKKGWKAPEMGDPEVSLSENCTKKNIDISPKGTIYGDSLWVIKGTDTAAFYGDKNKVLTGYQTLFFSDPGAETLTLIRFINCVSDTATQQVNITQAPHNPGSILTSDTIYSCSRPEFKVRLETEMNLNYSWSDGQTGPEATFTSEGTYILTSSNECGAWKDTITVIFPEFLIPNLITPNEDKKNDFFTILPEDQENGRLEIYNRWGEKIFKSDTYQNNWPKNDIEDGIYYYLYISNRGACERKGWVQVVR